MRLEFRGNGAMGALVMKRCLVLTSIPLQGALGIQGAEGLKSIDCHSTGNGCVWNVSVKQSQATRL